eukprot:730076-Rhodomonas_salina.2
MSYLTSSGLGPRQIREPALHIHVGARPLEAHAAADRSAPAGHRPLAVRGFRVSGFQGFRVSGFQGSQPLEAHAAADRSAPAGLRPCAFRVQGVRAVEFGF